MMESNFTSYAIQPDCLDAVEKVFEPFHNRRALIVGGSRGIGLSLTTLLKDRGWNVDAPPRAELDMTLPDFWDAYFESASYPVYNFVCFCAGDLNPFPWDRKDDEEYDTSYWVHALGPLMLLARYKDSAFPWWTKVCFISSVGAINDGIVDLAYGMSKAALDKAAKALQEHEAWDVHLIRFDLVDTDILYRLPTDTLHGRPVMTARQAAEQIAKECGL